MPDAGQLIDQVGQGLSQLVQVVSQNQQVPPETLQALQQVEQAFAMFVESLSGGGQEQQGGQGVVPQETGGKPAIPAM